MSAKKKGLFSSILAPKKKSNQPQPPQQQQRPVSPPQPPYPPQQQPAPPPPQKQQQQQQQPQQQQPAPPPSQPYPNNNTSPQEPQQQPSAAKGPLSWFKKSGKTTKNKQVPPPPNNQQLRSNNNQQKQNLGPQIQQNTSNTRPLSSTAPVPSQQNIQTPPANPIFTEKEASIYPQSYNRMDQKVFLYAEPIRFAPIRDYYKSKHGITMFGTSQASALIKEYQNTMTPHILIYLSREQDLQEVLEFLKYLINIKISNVNMINIYLVILGGSIDQNMLSRGPLLPFMDKMKIYPYNYSIETLTQSVMDRALSEIVRCQPAYLEDEPPLQAPKKAEKKKQIDVSNIFRIKNADELRELVDIHRSVPIAQREKLDMELKDAILQSKSPEELIEIASIMPEVQELQKYGAILDEYIQELENAPGAVYDVNELIKGKLLLNKTEEEVIRGLLDTVIDHSREMIRTEAIKSREQTENLVTIFNREYDNVEDLWTYRQKLKEETSGLYQEYKRLVNLASNSIVLRKELMNKVNRDIVSLVSPQIEKETIDERMAMASNELIKLYTARKKEHDNLLQTLNQELINSVNLANNLLSKYEVVVEIDQIVVESLQQQNKKLRETNISRVNVVDTLLKSKGILYNLIDPVLQKLIWHSIDPNTLVVYFQSSTQADTQADTQSDTQSESEPNTPAPITPLPATLIANRTQVESNKLLEYQENNNILPNIITISGTAPDQLDKLQELLPRLNYLAKKYGRIIFMSPTPLDKIMYDVLLEQVIDIVTFVDEDEENLLTANRINNIIYSTPNTYIRNVININSDHAQYNEIQKVLGTNSNRPTGEILISTKNSSQSKESLKALLYKLYRL